MVTYIRSDLEFILEQIKISEAHAAYVEGLPGDLDNPARPLFGPGGSIPSYNIAWGVRTVDGSYNHLLPGQEQWGASDRPFPELLEPVYRSADGTLFDPDGPGPAPAMPTAPDYSPSDNPDSLVFDSSVRTISNLIVDQTLGNPAAILTALQRAGADPAQQMTIAAQIKAAYDPLRPLFQDVAEAERAYASAAAAAAANPTNVGLQDAAATAAAELAAAQAARDAADDGLMVLLEANGITLDGANVHLPNVAPDEGLSAPFNSWFTLFGQFFDHGLDLVNKGGSGTVFVPLQEDDPLYVPGSPTNFMVLTRATVSAGPDGVMGTADDVRPVNTTTPFVDQNQTYASHASHQVFLREYEADAGGVPHATGRLIEGANGGMATWAEVKAQAATVLGIQLTDLDVGRVPLLRTDPYGNFIPGGNGLPQLIVGVGADGIPNTADDDVMEGNLLAPVDPTTAGALRTNSAFLADIAHTAVPDGIADGDTEIGGNIPEDGVYDNELLDAHFIAGDGRANENIGLTAVHHVFHAEHNRLVEHTKQMILDTNDDAFIAQWQFPDGSWNGERLFQAAKFGTEMQYQHLVFEEFARKIQPTINTFLVPDGFDTTLDPTIVAEFAHVVYRFGHSMLTESIDQFDGTFTPNHVSLIQGFLNPTAFTGPGGTIDDSVAAGAIIRGMTRQVGNEIDEFVTSALRNNLLGLPLDLATINLARGRDAGVPSLNAARRDFYEASNQNVLLKPYDSWVDYAGHLKHEASIINFIAAYGTHSLITSQTTIEGKRDAALTIITGDSVGGLAVPADAVAFLNGTGAYATDLGGLENVDLWIGGLAEEIMPFGGMLGATFNFVFEVQMEMLQSGDRFYYLQRLDGLHLFGEMENNSFAGMIMRNTDALHLPSDVFSTPGLILEVDKTKQYNPDTGVFLPGPDGIVGDDPLTVGVDESLDDVMDTNADPVGDGILTQLVIRDDPSTPGVVETNYLHYTGGDHVVLGGTELNDTLIAGIGDDTLYGDGGADDLNGGFGNDIINGGDGDDIIVDAGGDDNIKGGAGNDVIHAGPGLDLVLAGAGNDFVFLGTDEGSEVFAGEGDDFVYGNKNAERILGNEGNDWIETGTFDGAPGDNFDEIFAHDGIDGHDVFLGDGGFDEFIGEGGDDIMVGSPGRGKMAGMSGWDWATYKDNTSAVNADLSIPIVFDEAPQLPENTALDEYQSMEGLSGSQFNDVLRGSNTLAEERLSGIPGGTQGFAGNVVDEDTLALISGLGAIVGAGYSAGDIILGGGGSDIMAGQMGDDILDGDKWLDVQIGVFAVGDTEHTGEPIELHDSMTTLASRMFSGEFNPGQLAIARSIKTADGIGSLDVAVFADVMGNYQITSNLDGTVTVEHMVISDGLESDGTDTLHNMEMLRFADQDFLLNVPASGVPIISDITPTQGQFLTADISGITDPNGLGVMSFQWQSSLDGIAWTDIGGANSDAFLPTVDQVNLMLRVAVSFTDGGGNPEQVFSAATGVTGALFNGTNATDVFVGTAGEDIVNGSGGNDDLSGAGGNDILNGEDGDDVLEGGEGDDAMDGGPGNDTASYAGAAAAVSVSLGTNAAQDTVGAGLDTLISIENLTGSAFDDTFSGNADANILDGGAGNDQMTGGAGDDSYVVSQAGDVVTEIAGGGTDTVRSTLGTYMLAANVENLMLGAGANIGVGNSLDNKLTGNAGDNNLNGVTGSDTVVLDGHVSDYTFSAFGAHTVANSVAGGNDILVSIESLEIGGSVYNIVRGTNAADTLAGAVTGTAGDDILLAFNGADSLEGFGGNDILVGGNQADSMTGGAGDDVYVVNNFTDFVSEAGVGIDTIYSTVTRNLSNSAQVVGDVENLTLFGTLDMSAIGNALGNVLTGNEGNNTMRGLAGDDTLNGGGGEDMLNGGAGDDTLDGGAGDDVIVWTPGGGSDVVNGGTEGAAGDTYQITGSGAAETFSIYTRNAAIAAFAYAGTAEIVITRTVGANAAVVISELTEIEEIVINAATASPPGGPVDTTSGGDTIEVFGDFNETSLSMNTIIFEGTEGDDTFDISALDSAHRIIFRTKGGNDTIIGVLRPEDVVELPTGTSLSDYEVTIDETGFTTLTGDNHTLSFVSDGTPQFVSEGGAAGAVEEDVSTPVEPSMGTATDDVLTGTDGDDTLLGLGGNDAALGGAGADIVNGGSGDDFLNGGTGRDIVTGGDGGDEIHGDAEADMLYGKEGNDLMLAGDGDDLVNGGAGDDTVFGGAGDDMLIAEKSDGDDVYHGDNMEGGPGNDTLDMSAITASITADLGTGLMGRGTVISGQTGSDTLWGVENIATGSGQDQITASAAVNVMDGGGGNDIFRFQSAADADGDTILGFQAGDQLDLSGMDAKGGEAGIQQFTLVSGGLTGAKGELMVSHETRDDGNYTIVEGNTTGGSEADFKISIKGSHDLTQSDFGL